jgi:hypothetical protein
MNSDSVLMLDTNLLLLLIVGLVDTNYVGRKRTNGYTKNDHALLLEITDNFTKFIITPNIATETSNFLGQIFEKRYLVRAREILGNTMSSWNEIFISGKDAVEDHEFTRLGLADTVILIAAKEDVIVLTDDFPLHKLLLSRGLKTENFTSLRDFEN